jgi:hypothetical protein
MNRKEKAAYLFDLSAVGKNENTNEKKKNSSVAFFSFLFISFRKKTTFCPRLFLSVFVFSASPATVRVATDVPHDHRTSHYHTSP